MRTRTRRRPLRARALAAIAAGALTLALGPAAALGLGRAAPGAGLMVTFSGHPDASEVQARLAGLGTVRPLVPEAGVWTLLVPAGDRTTARGQVLARLGVRAAEWPALQGIDGFATAPPPVTPPLPLVPPGAPPTNPLFLPSLQWGLFPPATTWSIGLTGVVPRPRIAILDSGVDARHPQWAGPHSPLVDPRSTYDNTANANDWGFTGHGTHVAGIAAAPADGIGIVGVAPAQAGTAEVIPVRVSDPSGVSDDATLMRGIGWAVSHGAKVINISAGGEDHSEAFQRTVDWAFRRALIVASVGNEGLQGNDLNYPAAYHHVLGVAAQCDGVVSLPYCPVAYGVARFSDHNASVDLIAPGVNILSTVPPRVTDRSPVPGYAFKDGTSMAAPFVAGVAALVFAQNRDPLTGRYPTPDQVLRQLERTATPLGGKGRNDSSGYGVVNPLAAVTTPLPPADPNEPDDDTSELAAGSYITQRQLPAVIHGTLATLQDPRDLYPLQMRRGQRVTVIARSEPGLSLVLRAWRPGTRTVVATNAAYRARNLLAADDRGRRAVRRITFRAPISGRAFVEVAVIGGEGGYRLSIIRRR